LLKGLKQTSRYALGYLALAAKVLDLPPDKTVNVNHTQTAQTDVTVTVSADHLTDAELALLTQLLDKIGLTQDKITPEDKALLLAASGQAADSRRSIR
jgi:hypothetical protein